MAARGFCFCGLWQNLAPFFFFLPQNKTQHPCLPAQYGGRYTGVKEAPPKVKLDEVTAFLPEQLRNFFTNLHAIGVDWSNANQVMQYLLLGDQSLLEDAEATSKYAKSRK